jgi:TolA-binding protein
MDRPPELSLARRMAILEALRRQTGGRWILRWQSRALAAAVPVVVVLLVGAGVVLARVLAHRHGAHAVSLPAVSVSFREPARAEPATSLLPTPTAEASEAPMPSASPASDRAKSGLTRRQAEVETDNGVSPIAQESQLLASALQKLRQEHDAQGALAVIRDYQVRFPNGALKTEAALVRLDALMASGGKSQALAALDEFDIAGPRAAELWTTRGELRANAGRCPEAIADFDRALARSAKGRLEERALYWRASCQSRLGQRTLAQASFEQYLARYPAGMFSVGTNYAGALGLGDTRNRGDASGQMGNALPRVELDP